MKDESAIDFGSLELVPFTREHEDELITLITSCYAEYGQKIELDTLDNDLLQIEESYGRPGCSFRVLLDEGRLIGSVAIKRAEDGEAELKRVFLDEAYRGRGLGKKLSLWAHAWARGQGYRMMHVWSDVLYETAHHLYRGLGARDTKERRELGGMNDVAEFYFEWPIE
ncbi:MAG: GNAT family N-acetyltransferase [Planctomycetota bacterium]|jgi:GNAT superfamily N-acetyltransferase